MSLPPVTTAQPPNALIITTAVNPTSSTQTQTPELRTRPPGWHAKSFGFDWNKRSDQHKYLVSSGLPEVHAAIVNDDWDLALELICSKDFGLLWLPPASQSTSKESTSDNFLYSNDSDSNSISSVLPDISNSYVLPANGSSDDSIKCFSYN